ncbi:hypothetical protein PMAYCL1PPCAC_26147, partial [Pristionchus mayeri]
RAPLQTKEISILTRCGVLLVDPTSVLSANRPHKLSSQSEDHSMADAVEAEVLYHVQNEHEHAQSEEDVDVFVGEIDKFLRRRWIHQQHVEDSTSDECHSGLRDSRCDRTQAPDEEAEFV